MQIARIGFTPVKGTRHAEHEAVELTRSGPVGDRLFCLVDPVRGRVLRTVENPSLLAVEATWDAGILSVVLPGGSIGGEPDPSGEVLVVDYWGRQVDVEVIEGPWSAAFSRYLGRGVLLARPRNTGAIVYGASVTLLTTASLRRLTAEAGSPTDSARFRSTFVVDGAPEGVEAGWVGGELVLGPARVRVLGPVIRCAVVDLDPDTGVRHRRLLRRLARTASGDGREPQLGVQAVVTRPGWVHRHDPVSVFGQRMSPGSA